MNRPSDQRSEYPEKIFLPFWSEIVGTLNSFHFDDDAIQIVIDNKILTCLNNPEEITCFKENLDSTSIGRRIAVLRTDNPDKPFRIHLIN
jgi:hypothetical protein